MKLSAGLLLLSGLLLALSSSSASAQGGDCEAVCRVPCVKPIAIPDRWDDATGVAGYMGGGRRIPDWRNNGAWDQESFTDGNGNGLFDPGEPYLDDNLNGTHDAEAYHPTLTGYRGPDDFGLELVLFPGSPNDPAELGQYVGIALPPVNKGTPGSSAEDYEAAWLDCEATTVEATDRVEPLGGRKVGPTNRTMSELIARDPGASWDTATGTVLGSAFPLSPRVFLLAVLDPRVPVDNASNQVPIVKVVAFFAERMVGPAEVRGRLMQANVVGETCGEGGGGFIVSCPVAADATSWGRLKAIYR